MNRRAVLLLVMVGVIIGSLWLAGVFHRRSPAPTVPAVVTPTVTIAIDPGHGGRDPGAVAGKVLGKNINLILADKLAALVAAHPGMKAILTRQGDTTVDLLARLKTAETANAVLYLSINANSYTDPSVHGAETLVDNTRPRDDPSWKLAEFVQRELIAATGARDRGVQSQALYLRHTKLPAVSVAVGFITCPQERAKLLDPVYQDKIAHGLLTGIVDYLQATGALPASTPPPSG